jgi:hypothetical protein
MCRLLLTVAVLVLGLVHPVAAGQAVATPCVRGELTSTGNVRGGPHYDMGSPAFTDIWVSPTGDDANRGASRSAPLATLAEAWRRVPTGALSRPHRIRLVAGTYTGQTPFLDDRHGTRAAPIVIQSELGGRAGRDTTVFAGTIDVANSEFVHLLDLTVRPTTGSSSAVHLQHGDHLLLRNLLVLAFDAAGGRDSHDLVKINQVTHAFVEDSDLAGATQNALDLVAVHCGHVIANDIHEADDWCAYVKGGAYDLRVEGNRFHTCDGGGFTAGQGTGFQFMVSPQIHYEAYDVKVVNNIVHDVGGSAFGAQGAYNVLIAHNTAFRAGQGYDHILAAEPGERTCDPGEPWERAACDTYRATGGWGPTTARPGDFIVHIPNKHVFIYNNVLWNDQVPSDQHLRAPRPYTNPSGFGTPTTVPSDDDLRLAGNIIANGGPDHPYATDGGCLDPHPTCGPTAVRRLNQLNTLTPDLNDPAHGDFRPMPGGNVDTTPAAPIPNFTWSDAPTPPSVPPGTLDNSVTRDFNGRDRTTSHPGAYYSM